MKAFLRGCISFIILTSSVHAFDSVCLKDLTVDVQGQVVKLNVAQNTQVTATVDGEQAAGAYLESYGHLDGLNRIVVELSLDQKPNLTPEQKTSYDDRLDHHTILTLTLVLDGNTVKAVDYTRKQDIDYGYGYESNDMNFSVLNVQACK